MSSTESRLVVNRANAAKSTGPTTVEGKANSSRNALRHGLLSSRLLLDDEQAEEFEALQLGLQSALAPVGSLELTIVERIAINIWRQRRLVAAETAGLELQRSKPALARDIRSRPGSWSSETVTEDVLEPFDAQQLDWCRLVVTQIETLGKIDPDTLVTEAPLVYAQAIEDANEQETDVQTLVAKHKDGLTGYVDELYEWCQGQIREAERRPALIALAEQVRMSRLVLTSDALEVLARYQTTLDNQLFKALRALREAQEWRLKTLQGSLAERDAEAT